MPKVVLALLQLGADAHLFSNVTIQLFDVTLGLFGAGAFGFSAGSLSFCPVVLSLFRQGRGGLNLV